MCALIHSPNIVTNGLVLALDAANVRSYPGSGTSWFDLSGNGNTATRNDNAANPVWNSAGYFTFSATSLGTNNAFTVADSPSIRNLNNMTVEIWFTLETKSVISGDSDWMAIISKDNGSRTNQIPAISINQGPSLRYLHIERPSAFDSSTGLFTNYTGNQWHCVTATISTTDNISRGYLNATQVSSASGGMTGNSNPIYIGTDSQSELFKGKLSIVKIYNRALSATEVQQNFNAARNRFGI